MCSCSVVIDYIEEYGHSSLMTGINELLVSLTGSIDLIQCKVCVSTVAPAVISVELLYRHKFDCIDT